MHRRPTPHAASLALPCRRAAAAAAALQPERRVQHGGQRQLAPLQRRRRAAAAGRGGDELPPLLRGARARGCQEGAGQRPGPDRLPLFVGEPLAWGVAGWLSGWLASWLSLAGGRMCVLAGAGAGVCGVDAPPGAAGGAHRGGGSQEGRPCCCGAGRRRAQAAAKGGRSGAPKKGQGVSRRRRRWPQQHQAGRRRAELNCRGGVERGQQRSAARGWLNRPTGLAMAGSENKTTQVRETATVGGLVLREGGVVRTM